MFLDTPLHSQHLGMKIIGGKNKPLSSTPNYNPLGFVGGMLGVVINGDPLGICWVSITKLTGHNTNCGTATITIPDSKS